MNLGRWRQGRQGEGVGRFHHSHRLRRRNDARLSTQKVRNFPIFLFIYFFKQILRNEHILGPRRETTASVGFSTESSIRWMYFLIFYLFIYYGIYFFGYLYVDTDVYVRIVGWCTVRTYNIHSVNHHSYVRPCSGFGECYSLPNSVHNNSINIPLI